MGFFSDLFDPGRSDRRQAGNLANSALLQGGAINGPLGLSGGFGVSGSGAINSNLSLGQFGPLLEQLLGGASGSLGGLGQGLPPSLTSAGADARAGLGPALQGELGDLSGIFQSALGTINQDPFELGAQVTDRLRPGLERAQGTLRNNTFDKLFSSGSGAVSSAASPVLEGLQRTFGEQNAALDTQGIQIGQSLRQNAIGQAFGSLGQSQNILGMNATRGLQGFGVESELFGLGQRADESRTNIGTGLLNAGAGLSQLPLAFQSALAGLQGLRSNSALGAAGVHQGNASMARSPFLEALTAAGGFASNIGLGFGGST